MKGLEYFFTKDKKDIQDQQQAQAQGSGAQSGSTPSKVKTLQSDMQGIKKATPIKGRRDEIEDSDDDASKIFGGPVNDEEQSQGVN